MDLHTVSPQTLKRLPLYLRYLKSISTEEYPNISATMIADALGFYDVQVRKDLAAVSSGGRPKIGYVTENLIADIKHFLGYDKQNDAVLVGAGNLGHALLSYSGFSEYGLRIIAAFDKNKDLQGKDVHGKMIYAENEISSYCKEHSVQFGIIATPASVAQQAADTLIAGGVKAILNFAPVHILVPGDVLVENVDMASSFAVLYQHVTERQ